MNVATKRKLSVKMIRRKSIVIIFLGLVSLVLSANIYFIYSMNNEVSSKLVLKPSTISASKTVVLSSSVNSKVLDLPAKNKNDKLKSVAKSASERAAAKIKSLINDLPRAYYAKSPIFQKELERLLEAVRPSVKSNQHLLAVANKWVKEREIVPARSPLLGSVLDVLSFLEITEAQNAKGGTQLKLLLTLKGGQKALFKPKWYERGKIIEGPVYSGKDRHNAEVAAFHLSLLLGLRRVPLTVGRKINLTKEVLPFASKSLLNTFYNDPMNNTCFYGDCFYCNQQDPVCANRDIIEGALIMMLPATFKLKTYRNPWQRTYKEQKAALWEVNENYCDIVKSSKTYNPLKGPRLLDLIDASVFDFLIDNGDRHHYEVLRNVTKAAVMLIDNGKSFGNPNRDHFDILAPLYQCCIIRQTTWERLGLFSGGMLGPSLKKLLSLSHISPVLTDSHFLALDRRLLAIFAAVENCFLTHGKNDVIKDDGYR